MNTKTKIAGHMLGLASLLMASHVNAAMISLTPSVANVDVSDTFAVSVGGTGFDNGATAGGITLTWDASILAISSIVLATGLQADGTGTGGTYEWTSLPTTSISSGELNIDAFFANADLFGNPFPVTGSSFDFLSFDFTVLAVPAINPLDVSIAVSSNGLWQDSLDQDVVVDFLGTSVTVNPVPVPAAAWLFGSGLIGLVGVARRKQQLA